MGILGSALNWVSNTYNNALQIRENRSQRDWNAQQATIAWDRSVEQWNRENEYNSPLAQMQRLREAGINPALAYASGVFNQAGTSPQADKPSSPGLPHTSPNYVDPYLMANLGLIEAQKEKTRAETEVIEEKLPHEVQQLKDIHKQNVQILSNLEATCNNLRQELENLKSQKNLTDVQAKDIVQSAALKSDEFKLACERWETERKVMLAQINRWNSQNKLDFAEIRLKNSLIALNKQEFEFNVLANVHRLLGLKLDNSNKKMDIVLKLDGHKLNGYEINAGAISNSFNLQNYNDYTGKNGFVNYIGSRIVNNLLQATSNLTGSVNFRLFK